MTPDPPALDIVAQLPALHRYALTLTRDPVDADDLVQEALLRACERADRYDRARPLRSWLLAILHNLFVDGHRRRAAEARRGAGLSLLQPAAWEGDQEVALTLAEVARGFAALPEGQRQVLHLVAIEGMSYREAAETLGVAIGTVMSRLSRARAGLRAPPAEAGRGGLQVVGGRDVD